ncbi:MAG: undecaprenyl/decaprenyl-phosphate alpha-N-acetylglucosaminyl 1-phosphate transferase [Candidatus Moranbacteria bacterium]|jgi:UDP-GlcNAc:undecaprenyl-phosphate GlcNAc-1-phosphate transferase|nr:undecaprenyl/decaprenyl-phosphate alpha-N-acetylglucosaminyl 1-phosphate transferase [Candidatus Moranbacteria bacterium]MBP9801565.1 undecaprenyl/decaprenyl-phosphate alpha-N-acetylglucosaminyl 1-phosphate transferase [Candidatus Moranbacteria bacterium]
MLEFFLEPFLVAFGVTTTILFLFLSIARKSKWLRNQEKLWFRFGGIALLCGFIFSLLVDGRVVMTTPLWGFVFGTGLVFVFSIWDDLFSLSWRAQIFFQVVLGLLLFLFEARILFITNPFGGVWSLAPELSLLPVFIVGLGWLMLVMNALNWLDGSDGLCGGVSFIALITIFFLSLKPEVYQPAFAIIAACGAGATLGFLLFNLPPARIFAGTNGAMFLGFLLVFLSTAAGTKIATALLILMLPVADAFLVISERFLSGVSIFEKDRRHLHHKLSSLGWSRSRITLILLLFTAIVAHLALKTSAGGKLFVLIFSFIVVILFSLLVTRRARKKEQSFG